MVAMTENDLTIMGKKVTDMYGSHVGKVIGTTTDVDGTVISVGVDCGYRGLLEVPYEHLVVQEDAVIYIPQWRLDSQKILRMKGLIIRRLRALRAILADSDHAEEEYESVQQEYEDRLATIRESEDSIKDMFDKRLTELANQTKVAKKLLFDATIQYKSSEIHETDFKVVKSTTGTILERIDYEVSEIKNMQRRLGDLATEEAQILAENAPQPEPTTEQVQTQVEETAQPEQPVEEPLAAPVESPPEPPRPEPTVVPPEVPAEPPMVEPTAAPSEVPPEMPAEVPAEPPMVEPTAAPSEVPPEMPAEVPAEPPMVEPTAAPSEVPPEMPAEVPAEPPMVEPMVVPPEAPSEPPRPEPTVVPPEVPPEVPADPSMVALRSAYGIPEPPPPPKQTKSDWLTRMNSQ